MVYGSAAKHNQMKIILEQHSIFFFRKCMGMPQMKTGKWFVKPVLLVTIFAKFGGILTALQPESTVCY